MHFRRSRPKMPSRADLYVQAAILRWEQANPRPPRPVVAPGTPDRKALQRAADEAWDRGPCHEWRTRRLAECQRLRSEARQQMARDAAAARQADPKHQLRQWVFRWLRKLGFQREHTSDKSAYYRHGLLTVRVSDHDVPLTDERQWNRDNGGTTWAESWRSFVIRDRATRMDAARWLVEVRRATRQEALLC